MRVAKAETGLPWAPARLWANASFVLRLVRWRPGALDCGPSYDAVRQFERERVLARECMDRLTLAARRPL
jgi:hypothetical protein